jgi:hypothetical protein
LGALKNLNGVGFYKFKISAIDPERIEPRLCYYTFNLKNKGEE